MKIYDVEQRGAEWIALRVGLPTASDFAKIITSTGEPSKSASGYALTLAAELFAGKPLDSWEGNAWTERGRELEEAAISLYKFMNDADVAPVGFVTDDAGAMGCSPDGFVGNDGLIEVKCLKAENHVKAILYYQRHGKCPPDYIQQTQGQMMICGRKWCDVVFYHPDLPLLSIRQNRDAAFQVGLSHLIPPLLKERDTILKAIRDYSSGNEPKGKVAVPTDPKKSAPFF